MRKHPTPSVLAAIGLLAPVGFGEAPMSANVAAIRVEHEPGGIVVSGVYEGDRVGALTYELTVLREGATGTTTTRQGGGLESRPGYAAALGFVRVNARVGDRVTVRLVVRRGEYPVAEASREGILPNL